LDLECSRGQLGLMHFSPFITMSNANTKIVIGGTIAIDHVKTPDAEATHLLGGSAAYAALVNRGVYIQPLPFEEIFGPDGELLWSRRANGPRGTRAVSSDIADAMVWMLQQVVQGGTGGGAALADRPVAGKTGTSEGARDLWFIGSIPQLTTGVWLGYDNNQGTGTTSVLATYAWRTFMDPVTKGMPMQTVPPKPVLTGSFKPVPQPRSSERDAQPDPGGYRNSQRW
jgi:penicillin-binding protein 1A